MAVKIQYRRDTSANWASDNPILSEGELGWDLTVKGFKVGDGTTAWSSLDFSNNTAESIASIIHAASTKNTPVDADEVGLIDSAASNVLKKLTWANLKATLKTYFDTLYGTVATVAANTAKVSCTTTNVNAAGATMNADTTLAGNGYFLDEDDMASDSATKVPSQQSVKAYADLYGGAEATSRTINFTTADTTAQIQAKIDAVKKYIPTDVSITFQFADGTYTLTDQIDFTGFYGGGYIRIYGNTADTGLTTAQAVYLNGSSCGNDVIQVANCKCYCNIQSLKIQMDPTTSMNSGVRTINSAYVSIKYCYFFGAGTSNNYGVYIRDGAYFVFVYQCYASNCKYGVIFDYASGGHVRNCDDTGTMPLYGLYVMKGAHVGHDVSSTQIDGSTADTYTANGTIV